VDEPRAGRFLDVDGEVCFRVDLGLARVEGVDVDGEVCFRVDLGLARLEGVDVDGEVCFRVDLGLARLEGVDVVRGIGRIARYRCFVGGTAWFVLGSTSVPISVAARHEKVTLYAYRRQSTSVHSLHRIARCRTV
jgi:hypothetical protein